MLIISIIILCIGAYMIGVHVGKRSRKIGLSDLGSPAMFAYLLKHERHRHVRDICQIDKDLADMARMGIYAPEVPVGLWIDVKK